MNKDYRALKGILSRQRIIFKEKAQNYMALTTALEILSRMEQEMSGWISVEDKVPDRGVVVIAYDPECGVVLACYGVNSPTRGACNLEGCEAPIRPSHWMPVPEPPKEGEDEVSVPQSKDLRDEFAMASLYALNTRSADPQYLAELAYSLADEMMDARKK